MEIILEYRLSISDSWEEVETDCTFHPVAPIVLEDELVIQYECSLKEQLPFDAEVRTAAEIGIYGSDEVFRLQISSP